MSFPFDGRVRNVLVGIDYEDIADDRGHLTLQRKGLLFELIEEIKDIMIFGCHFPQFPPEANPTLVYAYDLDENEDSDITGEISNLLNEVINRRKINGSNYKDN